MAGLTISTVIQKYPRCWQRKATMCWFLISVVMEPPVSWMLKLHAMASRLHWQPDVTDFMNALKIDKAIIGGFDWGARTANIVAALWPERTVALVVCERLPDRQPAGQ